MPMREPTVEGRGPRWIAGIDGLRALAVVAVLAYHVAPAAVPGGFVGVDLFFVISGFLITRLLLDEWRRTGNVDLRSFWRRRARRIVPAATLTLVGATAAALVVGGDVLVSVVPGVLGAVTMSANWVQLFAQGDYFARSRTGLFDNFWSLAVEEQFYLLWPPAVLLLARAARRPARRAACVVLAAAVAAVVTLGLGAGGLGQIAYLATFGHAAGLLGGAALAHLLDAAGPRAPRRAARSAATGLLALGLVAFAVLLWSPAATQPLQRPLLTVLGSAAGCAMVLGCAVGHRGAARLLDAAPLAWVGRRSYGLYLWHLPAIVLADAAFPPVPGAGALPGRLLAVAAALSLAAASYRWVEQPIRRDGFRPAGRPALALTAGAGLALALGVSTVVADLRAPSATAAERAVSTGGELATPERGARAAQLGHRQSPVVVAIGDSVMLASRHGLEDRFPGITVDAVESRQLRAAPDAVEHAVGEVPDATVVVIGLGINGVGGADDLEASIEAAGDRSVVLVTVSGPVGWESSVNQAIESVAAEHANVAVADWRTAARAHPDLLARDGIHPGEAGGRLYADAVADAIATLG